jgi:hypothetical protein
MAADNVKLANERGVYRNSRGRRKIAGVGEAISWCRVGVASFVATSFLQKVNFKAQGCWYCRQRLNVGADSAEAAQQRF